MELNNGKRKMPINIIIHNPNDKNDFDRYYSSAILDTIKLLNKNS